MEHTPPTQDKQDKKESEYQKLSGKEFSAISWWVFKLIFSMHPFHAALYVVMSILRNFKSLISAFLFARLIDVLIKVIQSPIPDIKQVYPIMLILLGYEIFDFVTRFLMRLASMKMRFYTRPQLRRLFYQKLNFLGIQTLEQPDINNKIYRADQYAGDLLSYYFQVVDFIAGSFSLVGTFALVLRLLPVEAGLIGLFFIPAFLIDKKFRSTMFRFDYETTEESRKAGWHASYLSSVANLPEINILGAFAFIDKLYLDLQNWMSGVRYSIWKKYRLFGLTYDFFLNVGILYLTLEIIKKALRKLISIGDVTFWTRTLYSFKDSLDQVVTQMNDMLEVSLRYKDVFYIFKAEPAFKDGSYEFPKLLQGPRIEFKNVSFVYPNAQKTVVDKLNLEIKPNEKIAIVGPNGAGKTTIIKLICRFYKPSEGKIFVNDKDVEEVKIKSFYKNMGVLFQDFNTYSHMTVRENIGIGNTHEEFDDEKICEAATAADAFDFIQNYPKKFGQTLSERFKGGIRPSTGQWQKIAIARFFYRSAPLVIFDEPTASIDAVSEYNIFNKIYDFFKGKTVIIVSHRFSTVRNADRIIVIEGGKIVEDGSHSKLMKQGGFYAKFFKLQAEGYREETDVIV